MVQMLHPSEQMSSSWRLLYQKVTENVNVNVAKVNENGQKVDEKVNENDMKVTVKVNAMGYTDPEPKITWSF